LISLAEALSAKLWLVMKRSFFIALTLLLSFICLNAQGNQQPKPTPQTQTVQQQVTDLSQYGIRIQPDKRLIIMMSALEATGFDPIPQGEEVPAFRLKLRKDLAGIDAELKRRMKEFFDRRNKTAETELLRQITERNGGKAPANPPKLSFREQASPYISLAYAMGQPPTLESPSRSDDLPGDVLEVLDFMPLVREFYNRTNVDELLPQYLSAYQAEGDRLRPLTDLMVRSLLAYLQMRPQLIQTETVAVKNTEGKNKGKLVKYETREHPRDFYIVPDLLAVPETLNFRVIQDSYYAIVPYNTNPMNSELRRAYLQFMVDPVVLKYNKEISLRRQDIRRLIDARIEAKGIASADAFVTVTRSLISALDVRQQESSQIIFLTNQARALLDREKEPEKKTAITKELAVKKAEIADESIAQLSDAYERGALLAFYFSDKLKEVESAGFEFSSFFPDMMASLNVATEMNRLTENATARERANKLREARRAEIASIKASANDPAAKRRADLVKGLKDVDEQIRIKDYAQAEAQLKELLKQFSGEPRIFFALGRVLSLSTENVTDEDVQRERLERALGQYDLAIQSSSRDTDQALMSRAYVAKARILEFFDKTEEAIKAYDAAIALGNIKEGAYNEAMAGKKKLAPPK